MAKTPGSLNTAHRVLEAFAAIISIALGLFGIRQRYGHDTIKPERIYSSIDAAEFMGIERLRVLQLIKGGVLHAMKGDDGNYRIVGQSIIKHMVSPKEPH